MSNRKVTPPSLSSQSRQPATMETPKSPKTPMLFKPDENVSAGVLRPIVRYAQAIATWQPPTLLGISLVMNILFYSYIVYPQNGFQSMQSKQPEVADLKFALWVFGFFCLYRMLVNYHVLQPLAFWLGAPDLGSARKFAQQALNMQLHLVSAVMLYRYLQQKYWYHDIGRIWDNWNEDIDPYLMLLYMLQCGYHANSLAFHFTDEVRADFLIMFVHHAATFALILVSYLTNEVRYGSLVLLLTDSSDVIGCLTKMSHYTMHRNFSVVLLPLLITAWFYTRCWLLPFWVVLSIPGEAAYKNVGIPGVIAYIALLGTLVALNYMWNWLMVKMAWNAIFNNDKTDLSEFRNKQEEAGAMLRTAPHDKVKSLLKKDM
eukprot:NODE_1429_length_1532_cov_32.590695_g1290_i0.p1 GENE.NODE_1429_length_1532_cov_32.590695_g1290_i0~~NODE_1429_length_1532_cov_32.590695_g1290_i0.p1  ORF type:complete len:390 (-),score=68.20 NODE_1429_length_1532_cov_32.590695_g1290_i0:363-1481(-)